jgi:hypothetical protein
MRMTYCGSGCGTLACMPLPQAEIRVLHTLRSSIPREGEHCCGGTHTKLQHVQQMSTD